MLDAENGRSVYRLAHRTFVEYFEQEWGDGREARELAVARGLIEAADEVLAAATRTGRDLDAYLVSHLAAHLSGAGAPGWQLLAVNEPLIDLIDPHSVASEVISSGVLESISPATGAVMMGAQLLVACDPADRLGVRQLVAASITRHLPTEPPAPAT